jgi:hypothetical protein
MRSCSFCGERFADEASVCCCCQADLVRNTPAPRPAIELVYSDAPRAADSRRTFYVYFHRDRAGQIFYIGKGTDRRAWSTERDENWKRYVAARSDGHFDVEIFRDGLNDAEACELESFLIGVHGRHLVNWLNPGQEIDYQANAEYHARRKINEAFVAETRPMEQTAPAVAIVRYQQALQEMDAYEAIPQERGLLVELAGQRTYPNSGILDRLTLCLTKAGRLAEAKDAAERFFTTYPAQRNTTVGKRVLARVNRQHPKESTPRIQSPG